MRRVAAAATLAALTICAPAALGVTGDANVSITSGPSGETTSHEAVFAFATVAAVAYTTCDLDGGGESRCGSPAAYRGLTDGAHRFLVRGYSSRGGLVGADARSWTIVAPPPPPPTTTPPPASPPPQQPPPPSPPPPPRLTLAAPPAAQIGAVVVVQAAGDAGPPFAFDLDGNASYETKCGDTKTAVAVFGKAGPRTVGVMTPSGGTAAATIAVGGTPALPPQGGQKLSAGTEVLGACANTDVVASGVKAYLCPTTVTVGVAEAVFPSDGPNSSWNAPAGACFKRTKVGGKDVFVAPHSPVRVNGVVLRPESQGGHVEMDAGALRLRVAGGGSTTVVVGMKHPTGLYDELGAIDWNIAKSGIVGDLQVKGLWSTHPFLGLPVVKTTSKLGLTAAKEATLPISVHLPPPLLHLGGSVTLRTDNTSGLEVQSFVIALDGELGIFPANGSLAYSDEGGVNAWKGTLGVFLAPGLPAVTGTLAIKGGYFEEASVKLDWPPPGYGPLGCCIFLKTLKGTITIPEIVVQGTFTGGPSAGDLAIASATITGYVKLDYFLVHGTGSIAVFGVSLGENAAFLLDDSTLWVKGGIDRSFLNVLKLTASLQGGIYGNGKWVLGGNGNVCANLPVAGWKCAGGIAGIGDEGVAGCLLIDYIAGGFYVQWDGDWGFFKDCWWSLVETRVTSTSNGGASVLGTSAEPLAVELPSGLSRVLFEVEGAGGAPRFVLRGPGGRTLAVPTAAGAYTDERSWSAVPVDRQQTTFVTILRPAGGTWIVQQSPGSSPIRSVAYSRPLPARLVTGRVLRRGGQWRLRFEARLSRGQTVTFVERGKDVEQPLTTTRRVRGELRFAPAESPARARRIDAVVQSNGIPVRTQTVARYRTPPLRPLPAPRLVAERRGGGAVARWLPVSGASGYRVALERADGLRRALPIRSGRPLRATLPTLPRLGVEVTVRAVSRGGRLGRPARASVAPLPSIALPRALSRSVLRTRGLVGRCVARADGVCAFTARLRGRIVARGRAPMRYGALRLVRARLTPAGRAALAAGGGGTLRVTAAAPGERTRTEVVRLR